MDATTIKKGSKRRRLNFACDYFRCDEQRPSCHACLVAGIDRNPAPLPVPSLARTSLPPLAPVSAERRTPGPASSEPETQPPPRASIPTPKSDSAAQRSPLPSSRNESDCADDTSGRFSGRLPMVPRISGSSILEIHTGWLELAFHRLGIGCGFSSLLSNKHPPSSNPASITLTLPRIPPESRCRDAIASYFATIHILYPILDPAAIDEAHKSVLVLGPAGMIEADRLPELLLLYLVLVLGSAETDHLVDSSDLATSYIGFCETMLGHALGWGTFDTVRITFLLALALRRADKITSAWPITGLCVSVAQMLGLHRKRSSGRRSPEAMSDEADQARRRAWWSIYAFENLFAFEIGRPSAIQDLEHDQLEPEVSASDGGRHYRYFEVVVGLARTLSQYHSALIMTMRNRFLISDAAVRVAVEDHAAGQPWNHVIRDGQSIAANCARNIIKILVEGHDRGTRPALHTATAPLQALYVLSMYLLRHPASRLAPSDINLIHNAGDFALEYYERFGAQTKVQAEDHCPDPDGTSSPSSSSSIIPNTPSSVSQQTPLGVTHVLPDLPPGILEMQAGVPMTMPDIAWSPALADEIGWDWGDFSLLFTEPGM
ncbi:unnamed protein product [Parascedosporium putredinis]|uniref:Xylanolytic transcriptional activator regulatory domain-containing protein n=1 Tax=Parascedosporium putredinis TaxID=1442378 RepID=A0A9P1HCB3_9PEZI|nr:unnamed protein product [Parascedosporium putredinis]CAI8004189.1 unnamed protein product [Parascedosporium putredinis]